MLIGSPFCSAPDAIRVALLDDHPIILYAASFTLTRESGITVTGAYDSAQAMVAGLTANAADVLLVDFTLTCGDTDGVAMIRLLRKNFPASQVLVYSAHSSTSTVRAAIRAGAQGYLGKSCDPKNLVQAVRTIASGRRYLAAGTGLKLMDAAAHWDAYDDNESDQQDAASATLPDRPITQGVALSSRERDVIRCYLQGMTVSEIARQFNRNAKTVSAQKASAYRKLGVTSDNALFKIAKLLGKTE